MAPANKKCPECAEEVKAEAKVCRFCGHRFDASTNGSDAPTPSQTAQAMHAKAERRRLADRRTKIVLWMAGGLVVLAIASGGFSRREVASTGQTQTASVPAPSTSPSAAPKPASAPPPTEEETQAAEDAACRKDLQCWGDRMSHSASFDCERPIENLSQYSFEWTDGWLEGKLSRFAWNNESKGIVTYWGDKIRFQNGFGAWQDHTYKCIYDTINERVIEVSAAPGRL